MKIKMIINQKFQEDIIIFIIDEINNWKKTINMKIP